MSVKDMRPNWDVYFLNICQVVSTRSNCSRRQVGAIIACDKRIVSTGYNGTPRGVTNCFDGGCPRCAAAKDDDSGKNLEACLCSHAEENALVQAAYHGVAVKGGALYCTLTPCLACAKMIINAGLRTVVYADVYAFSDQTTQLLTEAGISFRWGLA